MMARRHFAILTLAGALAACTAPGPKSIGIDTSIVPRCRGDGNPNDCAVRVTVRVDGDRCQVSVPADQVNLVFRRAESDRNRFIYWTLEGPSGYTFTDDGIFIPANSTREFDKFRRSPDGLTYRVRNRNTGRGEYKYSIRVINEDAGFDGIQCELDPFIRNS